MLRFVYITTDTISTAKNIARTAVESRLAACGNILPSMHSIYRWKEKIEETDEVVLILKTTEANLQQLEQLVLKLHPFECPCFISIPINQNESSTEYVNWLSQSCTVAP